LSSLVQLESLTEIDFFGAPLDAKAIEVISSARALRQLRLGEVSITAETARALSKFSNLELLWIDCWERGQCGTIDEGVMAVICGLRSLKNLRLSGMNVDERARALLHSKRPDIDASIFE
jgi:hypothetical protein